MEIELTSAFLKELTKLTKSNRKLKERFSKQIRLLSQNQTHPSLRLHKIDGKKRWSISIDMSIRVLFSFDGRKITLRSIGTHDEVY